MIENSAGWRYVQSADTVADYPTVSAHNAGKFQELKSQVDGKAPSSHTHSTSQVTGLDAALAGKAPLSHTHPQSEVTGLDAALAGKAPLTHTHSTSQVTGLDAALAGKAPLTHTHSTSQVTGLDAALAGKAASSTLDDRIPAGLALRVDSTVGTCVFAGSTMIYGDTGLRRLAKWDTQGTDIPDALKDFGPADANLETSPGGIWICRQNDLVTLTVAYAKALKGNPEIRPCPPGFGSTASTGKPYPSGPIGYAVGSTYYFSTMEAGQGFLRFRIPIDASIRSSGSGGYGVEISWHTREPWPTSLPGLPA